MVDTLVLLGTQPRLVIVLFFWHVGRGGEEVVIK